MVILFWLVTLPTYLYTNFAFFSTLMAIAQYLLTGWMLIDFINKKFKNCSTMLWLIMISMVIEVIVSFYNPYALPSDAIISAIKSVGFLWLIRYEIKKEPDFFLSVNVYLFGAYVLINLLTLILFPNGMYRMGAYTSCYFLGYDNTHINLQLRAMALACMYSAYKKGRIGIGPWFIVVISFVSALITMSATTIIGIIVFVIALLAMTIIRLFKSEKKYMPTPLVTYISGAVVSILLIGGSSFGGIKDTILNLFGKDSTLAARTLIWRNSLNQILKSPFWGFGSESSDTINSKLVAIQGQTGWGTSTHNFYLMILYIGGICLMVVITLMFLILNNKYNEANRHLVATVCAAWILCYITMGITESHYDGNFRITMIYLDSLLYMIVQKNHGKENG